MLFLHKNKIQAYSLKENQGRGVLMERTISVEEKIKRAEEIYERRHRGEERPTVKISNNDKKDIRLFKKLIMQVIACLLIYLIIYTLQNNDNLFSQDFINKAREILSYDTDFMQMYNNTKDSVLNLLNNNEQDENKENKNEKENIEQHVNSNNENIEQQVDSNDGNTKQKVNNNDENIGGSDEKNAQVEPVTKELTEEEKMIQEIKNTTTFVKPVEGTISSKYGQREPTTSTVPKNHTGIDIAANTGTKIKSATSGEVVLASSEGDYRKSRKDFNRRSHYNLCTL